jgi:hypothetical protein
VGCRAVATARREAEEEEDADAMFVVDRGGYRREGSITSVARNLFGRAFGTSTSDPRFISKGTSV